MANYYGSGRSNYVKFKDSLRAKEIAKIYGCEMVPQTTDSNLFCILAKSEDGEASDFLFSDEEQIKQLEKLRISFTEQEDKLELPDFLKTMAELLDENYCLVWFHVGTESMKHITRYARYIRGYAITINAKGVQASIDLNDIYKMSKLMAPNVTLAEY